MAERQLGPWKLRERIGRGGNAVVYQAEHVDTGEEGALKEINAKKVNREPYQRFVTEIRTLQSLGPFPGVLPVIDSHIPNEPTPGDQPWLVMRIARPLRETLADKDLPAVVAAVGRIASTLASLQGEHGLAHRDIKPANLYELDGEAAIGDFGLVALPDRTGLTKQGKALGPVNFASFEMLNEPATADPFMADVYALAKTMWALACGVDFPPPGHQPASAAPHRIADYRPHPNASHLDELIDRATVIDPKSRPAMASIASDLAAWEKLPTDSSSFDLAEAVAAVRHTLSDEIVETDRVDRWKEAMYAAIRRFDELAATLNEALRAADPRARMNVIDSFVDGYLKTLEEMGSPAVLVHWTRASTISAGAPIPYVLRVGRGLELIENGTIIIRALVDLGLEGVMQTDFQWASEPRVVPAGSTEQELALTQVVAELSEQMRLGLQTFARTAGMR